METVTPEEFATRVGTELGISDWVEVDQDRITAFADVTDDHQFIHVDPEAAAQTPLGTTVAHGYLTLSLITPMLIEALPQLEGTQMVLNYGSDRIRYVEPVRAGSRLRARTVLKEVTDKGGGRWLVKTGVTVEIEGSDKPALVAEILSMMLVA